jgi:prepilin-type N-terminal cleavage/methylation domain-containing protein
MSAEETRMSPVEPSHETRAADGGFTLIELLVAMTVTLIITGAMYGLLAGGQNAFRREPELTDRQQAIRMAMDRIQRDVVIGGQKMGTFAQAFTDRLNGDGIKPIGGGAGPMEGPNGPTDILEVTGSLGECPDVFMVEPSGANLEAHQVVPSCYREPGPLLLLYPNGVGVPVWGHNIHAQDQKFNLPSGQNKKAGFSKIKQTGDITCGIHRPLKPGEKCPGAADAPPTRFASVSIIRYVIAPDPVDGVPSLWRSDFGGFSDGSSVQYDDPLSAPADAAWRLIARGVEDLQVQYRNGTTPPNTWLDEPGLVDGETPNHDTIVREVRVLLGARTVQANLQGARTSTQGGDAVRGQLEATITPRAAMFYLGQADLWN